MIKPQDIVVLAKLILLSVKGEKKSFADLAKSLVMSPSEVHAGVGRLTESRLIEDKPVLINKGACEEFLFHGLQYVFPSKPGPLTRGIPTSHGVEPLSKHIVSKSVYVWPFAQGKIRGEGISPLYRSVPQAVSKDSQLHQFLALLDGLRIGRVRERKISQDILVSKFLSNVS